MKTILKTSTIAICFVVMLGLDVAPNASLGVRLVPDAHAIIGLPFTPLSFAGVARRTAFRSMAYAGAASATAAATASAAEANEIAAQNAAAAAARAAPPPPPPPAAVAPPPAAVPLPPPVAAGKPLPLGTVVSALPAGCVSTPVGGINYFYCGGNFYRAVFQGNNLVYVTAQP